MHTIGKESDPLTRRQTDPIELGLDWWSRWFENTLARVSEEYLSRKGVVSFTHLHAFQTAEIRPCRALASRNRSRVTNPTNRFPLSWKQSTMTQL
jgi:hypothetical protein